MLRSKVTLFLHEGQKSKKKKSFWRKVDSKKLGSYTIHLPHLRLHLISSDAFPLYSYLFYNVCI